ncbi:MAG: 3-phosphoshikimate 1-carboxyvinyltransferase [Candidatus Hadarchaeaceae archaeon]
MDLVVNPATSLKGEIEAPPSKFHTQFSTALAILAGGKCTIESPLKVRDTQTMLKAAESLGAVVKRSQEKWTIWGVDGKIKSDKNTLDAKNSGTSICLLTSVSTLSPTTIVLHGDSQLRSRPMPSFLKALRSLGADVYSTKPNDSPPFIAFGGGINGGKVKLDFVEPRYLPSVLIAAPYAKKRVELTFKSGKFDLISELMKIGHVRLIEKRNTIIIPSQTCRAFNYRVPREISGAAPFMIAASLTGSSIKIKKMGQMTSRDKEFLNYLKSFGIEPIISKKHVSLEGKHKLKATRLKHGSAPELLPFVAVIACMAKGKTIIYDAAGARTMKSDRISSIANELRRMGAKVLEKNDGLIIQGPVTLRGCEVDGHNDYAITAALVVAAFLANGPTTIKNGANSLISSYSRFISTFQAIGAEISYRHPTI